MSDDNQQFVRHVNEVLNNFERAIGNDRELGRTVYAIVVAQTFKRYIGRFGIRSAKIVLRNLYAMVYDAERITDQALQERIKKASKGQPGPDTTGEPPH